MACHNNMYSAVSNKESVSVNFSWELGFPGIRTTKLPPHVYV